MPLIDDDFSLDSILTGVNRVVDIKLAFDNNKLREQESRAALATRQAELGAQTAIAQLDAQARVDLAKLETQRRLFDFSNMGRSILSGDSLDKLLPVAVVAGVIGFGYMALKGK